jgi:hypothetical protein
MAKITYANKEFINENANIPAINKVQDTDLNEIKTVVNGLVSDTYSTDAEQSYSCNYINSRITTLYTNNSGSNTDITLSDSVSNYSYLEVYGYNNAVGGSIYTKYDVSSGQDLSLFTVGTNGSQTRLVTTVYTVSGTTLTVKYTQRTTIFNKTIAEQGSNAENRITKVLGIK